MSFKILYPIIHKKEFLSRESIFNFNELKTYSEQCWNFSGGMRGHKKNKKCGKLGIFYDVQIFRIQEKNTSCARSQAFHKVCVQCKGLYIDRSTCAYILSLSDWKWKFVFFLEVTHFTLPSESWISINKN